MGINRLGVKLIAKILPQFEHYICIGFGILPKLYKSEKDHMGGTWQGNRFLAIIAEICHIFSFGALNKTISE